MKKFLKLIFKISFLFIISINCNADVITKINIEGNNRVSDETIKLYGKIKLNKDISDQEQNNILNNLNSTNFFEDIKINQSNGVLNIFVVEYPVVNQLVISGEPSSKIKNEIKKRITTKAKRSFIKSSISNDIDLIKKLYSSIGYNFVNGDVKTKQLDETNFDILIDIKRGEETKISSISFVGDKKVRANRLRNVIASERHRFYKIIS